MIKHTLEISSQAAHLAVRQKQLLIQRDGQTVGQTPCEDIGVLVVDHPGATYTHAALVELAQHDAAVVICGPNHLPTAVVLPLADHSQVVLRLADQLAASKPLCKRLWQQLVRAKIERQADNLAENSAARKKLQSLIPLVRSGDPTNVEARAAKHYWANWMGEESFRRDYQGEGLNALMNYGYAVVRAALARAIVAAGLSPAIGLHHCNRSNAFCLADDLIEPLRPLVDDRARELHRQGYETLTQEAKGQILALLSEPVQLRDDRGPLMVQLHRYIASLVHCFEGECKQLAIPIPCQPTAIDLLTDEAGSASSSTCSQE